MSDADIVIVGAGSAGCVLANRLSADGRTRVLLLEAGGDDRPLRNLTQFFSALNIHIPAGFAKLLGDRNVDWAYTSEPDPNTRGRTQPLTRGKVLGGSSSINALLYVRGQSADFDGWRQMGCTGWAWDDVEGYFRKAEARRGGLPDSYGLDGPLTVSPTPLRHPVTDAALAAWAEAGIARNDDYNGPEQEGAALLHLTARKGFRQSTAIAYLHPAMRRPNLRVITGALASEILFDGDRACGVAYRRGNETRIASATAEVILCSGAINSPQLLQLSGIGPGDFLRAAGIVVRRDVPAVGAHMQDHYTIASRYRLRPGSPSLNAKSQGLGLLGQIARFALDRGGLLGAGGVHGGAFVRSRPELETPDLQFFMTPATLDYSALSAGGKLRMEKQPGFTMGGYQMRPNSTGSVIVRSADPSIPPAIVTNYLADATDRDAVLAVLRWTRTVSQQPAFARYLDHEIEPGIDRSSDETLMDYARAHGTTAYHPVGTCRMGGQPDTVLDPQLRVRGVEGLRVVDASIMPRIVSGNTNAATIMIAERAADFILQSLERKQSFFKKKDQKTFVPGCSGSSVPA